jgi:hypothetical protein
MISYISRKQRVWGDSDYSMHFWTLRKEETAFIETSQIMQQTTWHNILEESSCHSLKSN